MPTIPTLPSQPNASVTFFDATTLDRTVRRRGPHDPLHRGPGALRRDVLPAGREFSYQGGITNTVLERFTLAVGRAARRPMVTEDCNARSRRSSRIPAMPIPPGDTHARSGHLRHPQQPAGAARPCLRTSTAHDPGRRSGAWATSSATAPSPTPAPLIGRPGRGLPGRQPRPRRARRPRHPLLHDERRRGRALDDEDDQRRSRATTSPPWRRWASADAASTTRARATRSGSTSCRSTRRTTASTPSGSVSA